MVASRSGDGPVETMRLATRQDLPGIVELYRGLSSQSQRMRFSTSVSDAVLARAASLDDGFDAVIALTPDGRVVGEARLDVHPDREHELAITVADEVQGHGVGTALLRHLREHAGAHDIVTLRAVVRVDNVPMLTLLRRVGGVIVMIDSGDVIIDIASDSQMPGWPQNGSATKVLVEATGLVERQVTTSLRTAGYDVRQCGGPSGARREPCPLITGGHCRLVEEADAIICLLPESDEGGAAVASDHAEHRPDLLATGRVLTRQQQPGRPPS